MKQRQPKALTAKTESVRIDGKARKLKRMLEMTYDDSKSKG